jgi:hypothetical protein
MAPACIDKVKKMLELKFRKTFIVLFFGISLIGVSTRKSFSTEFSIDGIFFNEKMPGKNGNLSTSLLNYDVSLQILKNDVGAINSLDSKHFIKIIGSTDDRECSGDECLALSLRRAQLIYQWMIDHGVPRGRFLPPEGHGNDEPIDNNKLAQGRARNRNVGFLIVPPEP